MVLVSRPAARQSGERRARGGQTDLSRPTGDAGLLLLLLAVWPKHRLGYQWPRLLLMLLLHRR